MNLYIKQKVFSFRDRFYVYDENGKEKYYVEGEVFSLGKKLHVFDTNGNQLVDISQQVFSFLPKFHVGLGNHSFEIKRLFTFFHPKYAIEPFGWTVSGNFFEHSYAIFNGNDAIAEIEKEWFSFGDAYAIRIDDGVDELAALSIVLVIDACIEQNNNVSIHFS